MFDRALNTQLHCTASFLMHSYIRMYRNLSHCEYIVNETQNSRETLYWPLWAVIVIKWIAFNLHWAANCSAFQESFRYMYVWGYTRLWESKYWSSKISKTYTSKRPSEHQCFSFSLYSQSKNLALKSFESP